MRKRAILSLAAAVLAGAAVLPGSSATAQDYERQVRDQINAIGGVLADYGLRFRGYDSEALRSYGTLDHSLVLTGGVTYAFAIACDQDCDLATLDIYDESGHRVGESLGSAPVVIVQPRWTGSFRVRTRLQDCRTGVCRVGVAQYSN